MTDTSNKVALVTGASRGIGHAIAIALGKQGYTVIGTATSEKGTQQIQNAFEQAGIKGTGLVLNVTDQNSVDQGIKTIQTDFGAPTILINNAGITRDNLMLRMKEDEWNEVIDTNLTGVYRVTRACLRGMVKARSGRIVTISSVCGVMGNPGQTNYSAAKAGVIAFSKSLAREVGSRGITVNVVAPGFIETDMTNALTDEQRQLLNQQIALGRYGQTDDIAAAVSFLVSESAGYITGETLHVNGGLHMV